jgi:pimeloyl-ACP methyl ester carboxylesterase
MAEELHTLLANSGISGPYLLVGHSLGGAVARQFASKYPDKVAGLVMVDAAHEQQVRHFPERLVRMLDSMKGMIGVMKWIGRSGILALNPKMAPADDLNKLPKQSADKIRAVIASSRSHIETTIAETLSVITAETQPVSTLGDLPLTVISHGQLDANAVPPGLGPAVRDEYERAWQQLQREIASLSTRSRQIVAERSGHNVIFDEPEIIIESILEMIGADAAAMELQWPETRVTAPLR